MALSRPITKKQKIDIPIRPPIAVTAAEVAFRSSFKPDASSIETSRLFCTSCHVVMKPRLVTNKNVHPVLQVLVCGKCRLHYDLKNFRRGKSMYERCAWCATCDSPLLACSTCPVKFCQDCIDRNFRLTRTILKQVKDGVWRCCLCAPQSIWAHRATCAAAKTFVENSNKELQERKARINITRQPTSILLDSSHTRSTGSQLSIRLGSSHNQSSGSRTIITQAVTSSHNQFSGSRTVTTVALTSQNQSTGSRTITTVAVTSNNQSTGSRPGNAQPVTSFHNQPTASRVVTTQPLTLDGSLQGPSSELVTKPMQRLITCEFGAEQNPVMRFKDESNDCVICMLNPKNFMFYPCGHRCVCKPCSEILSLGQKMCPICRREFKDIVRVYV